MPDGFVRWPTEFADRHRGAGRLPAESGDQHPNALQHG